MFSRSLRNYTVLLTLAVTAACSSSPEQNQPPLIVNEHAAQEQLLEEQLQTAIGFIKKGHFYAAEDQLKIIANEARNPTRLRQQALSYLTLLYLNKDNPRANSTLATHSLDQLNVLHNGRQNEQAVLFEALGYALEARIMLEEAQRRAAQSAQQQQQLSQEVQALQMALDQLRRLSLQ
ncbi:hypothetical protein [Spongiibacter sp.]|uniref:hypothetical protein n=1 Tax=Spongiibacter sp. TaxID=2024860 RepID=UPI0035636E05